VSVTLAETAQERTFLEPRYWDPGPYYMSFPSSFEDDALLKEPLPRSALTPAAMEIFHQFRELLKVTPVDVSSLESADAIHRWFRWFRPRKLAIRARTLNHWADLTVPTRAVEPTPAIWPMAAIVNHATIDMCVCLAVHLFTALAVPNLIEFMTIKQAWHIELVRCESLSRSAIVEHTWLVLLLEKHRGSSSKPQICVY
jgi:hypothetical protein